MDQNQQTQSQEAQTAQQAQQAQHFAELVANALKVSTDPIAAAGVAHLPALAAGGHDQLKHVARCLAAFTTDDGLFAELSEIVDESPAFMVSKISAVRSELTAFDGRFGVLEQQVWTRIFAGRRERARVIQTLRRRSAV